MNKMTIMAALVAVTLVGCKSDDIHHNMRVDPAPLSEFLPDHDLLIRQPDTFPFHYFYLDESVSTYENIYIAPVNIDCLRESSGWAKFDAALGGTLGITITNLTDFTRRAYVKAFENEDSGTHLKVTERKDLPKTLVLESAIIAVRPTKAELNVAGIAGSMLIPGIGLATSLVSSGSVTIECRVRDANTGKIIAMYADTEKDPKAVLQVAQLTWTQSTRINVKEIAAQTATVLSAKDYRTIRRRFPIRFAARIIDGNL